MYAAEKSRKEVVLVKVGTDKIKIESRLIINARLLVIVFVY